MTKNGAILHIKKYEWVIFCDPILTHFLTHF